MLVEKKLIIDSLIRRMKWKYGFVTFVRPMDAYRAIDDSSKNASLKNYDVSFGGRRTFCRDKYLDLGKSSPSLHGGQWDFV